MGLSVKADTRGLTDKIKRFRGIGRALDQASADMATEALRLLDEGYGRRRNPYGTKWRARRRPAPWPILEKSGRLRGSLRVLPMRRGFKMSFGTRYGIYHQRGTRSIARRAILPDRGLPAKWRRRLGRVAEQAIVAHLEGR